MKTFIITLAIVCVAATAGTIVYSNSHKAPPVVPVAELSPPPPASMPPETIDVPKPEPARVVSHPASAPAPAKIIPSDSKPAAVAAPHSKAGDTLVSAQTSYGDRWALLKKLKKLGELDAAIVELKRRAADNPNDPGIPIALGEAIMNKFPVKDFTEAAMLGLQIDQSFDAALKLDPASWEAQYEKANSMSYWPAEAGNKGPEVIQRLSSLIDQQDTMPAQPQFAQTYVLLGEQYQKAGQSDYATATWHLGLVKFPNDPALQKKPPIPEVK